MFLFFWLLMIFLRVFSESKSAADSIVRKKKKERKEQTRGEQKATQKHVVLSVLFTIRSQKLNGPRTAQQGGNVFFLVLCLNLLNTVGRQGIVRNDRTTFLMRERLVVHTAQRRLRGEMLRVERVPPPHDRERRHANIATEVGRATSGRPVHQVHHIWVRLFRVDGSSRRGHGRVLHAVHDPHRGAEVTRRPSGHVFGRNIDVLNLSHLTHENVACVQMQLLVGQVDRAGQHRRGNEGKEEKSSVQAHSVF